MKSKSIPLPPSDDASLMFDIDDACMYLKTSRSTFRRRFIDSGLVQLVDLGGRKPLLFRERLREAVVKIAAEQKADPSLVKPRSGGAVLKARGVIGNKWGRNGKAAAERKAARKS